MEPIYQMKGNVIVDFMNHGPEISGNVYFRYWNIHMFLNTCNRECLRVCQNRAGRTQVPFIWAYWCSINWSLGTLFRTHWCLGTLFRTHWCLGTRKSYTIEEVISFLGSLSRRGSFRSPIKWTPIRISYLDSRVPGYQGIPSSSSQDIFWDPGWWP